MVNSKIVARGEVVVVDENFGLRITQLMTPEERLKLLGKE
jgi:flagellar motor switch protein FliN/FliY